jgi:hypothetical protein
MRYLFILIAVLAVAWSAGNATGASASGVSPATLREEAWDCVDFGPIGIHCGHEGWVGSLQTGEAEEVTLLVFSNTDGQFLGTEQNIRADLYQGQPCPSDPSPSGQYTDLSSLFGVPYFACHRYDSPF